MYEFELVQHSGHNRFPQKTDLPWNFIMEFYIPINQCKGGKAPTFYPALCLLEMVPDFLVLMCA